MKQVYGPEITINSYITGHSQEIRLYDPNTPSLDGERGVDVLVTQLKDGSLTVSVQVKDYFGCVTDEVQVEVMERTEDGIVRPRLTVERNK